MSTRSSSPAWQERDSARRLLWLKDNERVHVDFVRMLSFVVPVERCTEAFSCGEVLSLLQSGMATPDIVACDVVDIDDEFFQMLASLQQHHSHLKILVAAPFAPGDWGRETVVIGSCCFIGGYRNPDAVHRELSLFLSSESSDVSMQGRLEEMPLLNVLRLAERGKQTCAVIVEDGLCEGRLLLVNGLLCHASTLVCSPWSEGRHRALSFVQESGSEAFLSIMRRKSGRFRLERREHGPDIDYNIHDTIDFLMEEAARLEDKAVEISVDDIELIEPRVEQSLVPADDRSAHSRGFGHRAPGRGDTMPQGGTPNDFFVNAIGKNMSELGALGAVSFTAEQVESTPEYTRRSTIDFHARAPGDHAGASAHSERQSHHREEPRFHMSRDGRAFDRNAPHHQESRQSSSFRAEQTGAYGSQQRHEQEPAQPFGHQYAPSGYQPHRPSSDSYSDEMLSLELPEVPSASEHPSPHDFDRDGDAPELTRFATHFPFVHTAIKGDIFGYIVESTGPDHAQEMSQECTSLMRHVEQMGVLLGMGTLSRFGYFAGSTSTVCLKHGASFVYAKAGSTKASSYKVLEDMAVVLNHGRET